MEQMTWLSSTLGSALVGAALGVVQCFWGYRLQKLWVALLGFALGLTAGFALGASFELPAWAPWCIGLVLGLLFAAVAFKTVLLGVFVVCVAICFGVAALYIRQPIGMVLGVGLGTGILVGVLAVKFTRPVMIAVTALGGGMNALKAIASLPAVQGFLGSGAAVTWLTVLLGLVLGVCGIQYQRKHSKK